MLLNIKRPGKKAGVKVADDVLVVLQCTCISGRCIYTLSTFLVEVKGRDVYSETEPKNESEIAYLRSHSLYEKGSQPCRFPKKEAVKIKEKWDA